MHLAADAGVLVIGISKIRVELETERKEPHVVLTGKTLPEPGHCLGLGEHGGTSNTTEVSSFTTYKRS